MIGHVTPEPADAASPCVKTCTIDAASGWCRGCGRTLDEIAGWGGADTITRRTILAWLPERMAVLAAPVA